MTRAESARGGSSGGGFSAALQLAVERGLDATDALTQLQQHTQCNICYDTYQVAMSLPCFHSFCSLCIRRCLHLNAACPLCHAAASSGDLRANFVLSQLSELVSQVRAQLLQHVTEQVRGCAREHVPALAAEEEAAAVTQAAAAEDEAKQQSARHDAQSSRLVPSAAASSAAALPAKVECPCCGLPIAAARINRHLDSCLGKEENQQAAAASSSAVAAAAAVSTAATAASSSASSSAASSSSSSRLPFPVYNLLTEKHLRKLLSELGFPDKGAGLAHDREALVRRHREFVLRHNSEQDAAACGLRAASSDAAIVRDIVRKDKTRTIAATGKQGKQILLNAFAGVHPDTHAAAVHTGAETSAHSARKRPKLDASAGTPAAAPPHPATRASVRHAATVLDLSEESPPPSESAAARSAPPSPAGKLVAAPTNSAAASAAAASPAPLTASAPAPSDPWSALVAQYESRHGPRKRWKRKWGEDASLYPPAAEPIDVEATETQQQDTSSSADEPAASSSAPPVSNAGTPSAGPKSVFALFAPAAAAAAPSAPAASSSCSSVSPLVAPRPPAGSSSSKPLAAAGQLRVSKVLCSSCHAVCKGSFPLGATVVCPRCRPAWPAHAAAAERKRREEEETFDPRTAEPQGWMRIAQQQQQQQQQQPHSSVSSLPAAAVVATVAPSPSAPSPSLSSEQRNAIEARRAAALAKLRDKSVHTSPPATATDSAGVTLPRSDSTTPPVQAVAAADAKQSDTMSAEETLMQLDSHADDRKTNGSPE